MLARRHVAALLIALFAAGCGKSRVEKLSDRAEIYNRSLRWSSLTTAGALIAQDQRRTLLEKVSQELAKNRIVDYSIVDLSVDADKKIGSVVVEFSFYGIVNQDLQYKQELQSWKYNSGAQDWFIVDIRSLGEGTK